MAAVYSTYEAKARFSELIRRARAGQRTLITHRGQPVAEIAPVEAPADRLQATLPRLEREGIIQAAGPPTARKMIVRRGGALRRFLESRK
jgi:prevent-host-death family protein